MLEIEITLVIFVAFIVFVGGITQVLVPLYQGRPVFPIFRRRASNLAKELSIANEELALEDQEWELSRKRALLEKKKNDARKKEDRSANTN